MQQPVTIKGIVSTGLEFMVMPNSGKAKCSFDLGVQGTHPQLGIPQEIQVHVVTWNEHAENVFNHVNKGNFIECTGRWDTRQYTAKSGDVRDWTEFICFKVVKSDVELTNHGFMRSKDSMLPDGVEPVGDLTPEWEGEADNGGTSETETSDTSSPTATEPS